ncbi:MAG: class I SAM-dependent methyltransferase [Acutalibacteraceae bacterium]|nr:class I SAM-dependent methyltransferase [Acutalibacteraceae bacterium]
MRYSKDWIDYELLDCSYGERLERWGNIILIRPDPQAIFKTERKDPRWKTAHARYVRSKSGGGHWETFKKVPDVWSIKYKDLTINLKPMGFKHTGLFPEQAVNWDAMSEIIRKADKPFKVLNLFAYTGGATLSCLNAGAEVTHVDASKGMVAWAKDNAKASGLDGKPVRWLVDDCKKFVQKEIRRGKKYHGIIMDPPSYGRGPGGEVWKIEDEIFDLVSLCNDILYDDAKFFLINSYTAGLSPAVMEYVLGVTVMKNRNGNIRCDEIGLPVTSTEYILPCGSSAMAEFN